MLRLLYAVCFLLIFSNDVQSVAVMSVDLGSEWMKVAIVSPGVPMEIALNTESKRKTPMAVAFRNNERTFGEDAVSVGVRFPSKCYRYFLDLVGKEIDHPAVKLFEKRFPYYDIVPDPIRGTVLFKHDDNTTFSPEELVGMMLYKAKQFAEESAGQLINEAVLVVPGYFNQVERKSVLTAAEFANLNVLQLINDYTAAALTYGIFRTKDINETAQYIMLFDMGASSTSAAIVSFQVVKTREPGGPMESNHQLSVIGVGYDRTLGGVDMQLRLRDHLIQRFNDLKKTTKDVSKDSRAIAKLFKEAGRLKNVLSANTDHYAQIEGLIDEIDVRMPITREEFENICSDLFERVKHPVEQALKTSGITMDAISQVILVGAGTRVPGVQQALRSIVKIELGKNLNTDEASVMGAVYKAADLSKGFKVKKFITKDAVLFPIQIEFEKEGEKESRVVKRTLYSLMNPYPQKKLLSFNKHQHDFSFVVHYGELDAWPQHEIEHLGPTSLYNISLSGVRNAIEKHQGANMDKKGIKVHFMLDESGILSLTNVEYVVEKILTAEELEKEAGQSTFSKISSTLTKLFQAAEDEQKQKEPIKPVHETPLEDDDQKPPMNGTVEEKEYRETTNETGSTNDKESVKSEDETKTDGDKPVKEQKSDKELKKTIIKEDIIPSEVHLAVPLLSGDQLKQVHQKIKALNEYDLNKQKYDSALNSLEAAIIETRLKLDNELQPFVTAEEQQSLTKKCDELSNWLEEEGYSATADTLESKLKELKSVSKSPESRLKEYEERSDMISVLDKKLNYSSNLLVNLKNLTTTLNLSKNSDEANNFQLPYTTTEIETLEKIILSTTEWKERISEEQDALPKSQDPVLTSDLIKDKIYAVDREVRYLINKSKNWKPPPQSSKKDEPKTTGSGTKTTGDETVEATRNETDFSAGSSETPLGEKESETEDIVSKTEKEGEDADDEMAKKFHSEL